jgi:multidrug resistance protein MdtO
MSTTPITAPNIPHAARLATWFPDFLRKELAPYPGRVGTVARMVIAATITTILIAVFRIPGGSIAVLLAIILSREDILDTARSAFLRVVAFVLAALFIPIGGRLFASEPLTHFLWEGVSIFLCFFLLRTLTNFAVASSLSLVVTNILAIWYLPGPAGRNVELTLWQVAAASLGALVTLGVELIFHAARQRDEVLFGVDERLKQMEDLMTAYAEEKPLPAEAVREISRYAVVGMGALRRHIARKADAPLYRMRMSTLVSLVGRSIDFAAGLAASTPDLQAADRERAARLAVHIADIRCCLPFPNQPQAHPAPWEPEEKSGSTPLLNELEIMMSLIPSVLSGDTSVDPRLEVLDAPKESATVFVRDAFTNSEHLRYAVSGTLAAMLCYILYMGLAWPTLATSVTTCVLTGLSNIGASRQKQVLRFAGAILGGFVFGMGAQIFVLPYIDTIGGFVVLCAAVTAVSAWVLTSSSRLSYAGLQIALAFFLITLSEPTLNLSLSVARDRVLGVLLGIFMMWLVFERFYPRPASDEMVDIFIRNTRLLADLVETTVIDADAAAIQGIRSKRDLIYRYFGEVNAQMDAVPFETGAQRAGHMAARDRIRRWQASERTFYLLQAPLLQFRVFANADERDRPFYRLEDRFREVCGENFRWIAASLEGQLKGKPASEAGTPPVAEIREGSLVAYLDNLKTEYDCEFTEHEQALYRMTRTLAGVVERMTREAAAEPIFATE